MKHIIAILAFGTAVSSLSYVEITTPTKIVCSTNTYYEVAEGDTGNAEAESDRFIIDDEPWLFDVTVTHVHSARRVWTKKDVNICAEYDSDTWESAVSQIYREMLLPTNFADKPRMNPFEASNAAFKLNSNGPAHLYEVAFTAKPKLTSGTILDPVTITIIASENSSGTRGPTGGYKWAKKRRTDRETTGLNYALIPFIMN